MKIYSEPEVKILSFLQTEVSCLRASGEGGDEDGDEWGSLQ